MKHWHWALANPEGILVQHAIFLREPEPLTVDQVTQGGFVASCERR